VTPLFFCRQLSRPSGKALVHEASQKKTKPAKKQQNGKRLLMKVFLSSYAKIINSFNIQKL